MAVKLTDDQAKLVIKHYRKCEGVETDKTDRIYSGSEAYPLQDCENNNGVFQY
jgi:hypothetical protein